MSELNITQAERDGIELVTFQGDINAANYTLISGGVQELLAGGKTRVVFDLSEVGYISSVGLGCLSQAHQAFARAGGRLAIIAQAEGPIPKLFKLTRLDTVLHIYADEAAALQSF